MKKVSSLFLLLGLVCNVYGQFVCGHVSSTQRSLSSEQHFEYGGVFTPRGNLRILIVFVSYGEPYDSQDVDGWPVDSDLPTWAHPDSPAVFYSDFSVFPTDIYSDTNRLSVSNFYYQMSNGTFKLIADYYPTRVRVDVSPTDTWGIIHKKALEQLSNSINWSLYDNRTNFPNYYFDNSNSNPDNKIDYIVFCHRFSWSWDLVPMDTSNYTSVNGFSNTSIYGIFPIVGSEYSVTNDGFTFITGGGRPFSVFIHEIGHKLYDAPHYAGNNNVCGPFFYEPSAGWGCMGTEFVYSCAAGWERYILNWTPNITANGVNSDISTTANLTTNNGIFILRDFITTGDAIRIKVKSGRNTKQYLWLENHQCLSTFDGGLIRGHYCGMDIDESKRGLAAYVELYSQYKEHYLDLLHNSNGVHWISRYGNHDFTIDNSTTSLCEKHPHKVHKGEANPIGGQSVNEYLRHDINGDGEIGHNTHYNNPHNQNEQNEVIQLDTEGPTAKYITGTGLQFQVGDKVGIARNPCVRNIPRYTNKLGDYFLNGISFEILDQLQDGSMVVKVRLDDVAIDRDVRWAAAGIVLTDITGDSRPDVDVQPSVTIDIDKSGTPNRHKLPGENTTPTYTLDDFITPTTFACQDGSYFKQEENSRVNVKNQSTLVLESGSLYEVGDGAVLDIKGTGCLHIKAGAKLKVVGSGRVTIKGGAYICIEDGADIELVNTSSTITLCTDYISGLPTSQSNCTSTPLTNFALATGSAGSIRECDCSRYIQDTTYYGDAHEDAETIHAGYHVTDQKPLGNVILENGSHVIMDADRNVRLEPGVVVKQGAILEVR